MWGRGSGQNQPPHVPASSSPSITQTQPPRVPASSSPSVPQNTPRPPHIPASSSPNIPQIPPRPSPHIFTPPQARVSPRLYQTQPRHFPASSSPSITQTPRGVWEILGLELAGVGSGESVGYWGLSWRVHVGVGYGASLGDTGA
jgi:hypothetical protein